MAIFTAAATALLAGTFLAGNAIAIGVVATGLAAGAQIGVSYALKAIAGNQTKPSNATDVFGVQGKLLAGGTVPRSFPLGPAMTPGQLIYGNTTGASGETHNIFLVQVIKLSDLPGCKLTGMFVNGDRVTVPGGVLTGPRPDDLGADPPGHAIAEWIKSPDPDYPDPKLPHLYVQYYDGTQTIADPWMVRTFSGSPDRPYQDTRVGRGCAYAIVTAVVNDYVWSGFPEFKFELSSIPLYDPSKDSTAGGSGPQRYSNPATWGGDGDNYPVVQAYNVLRGIRYGGEWVYGLQTSTAARVPAANWIAQIEKCRTAIDGEDGPEPTYRSGMMINVDTQPMNALKEQLTACQGRLSEVAGWFKIFVGAPDSPVFFFTDDDIVSIETQVFRPFLSLADSVNGIQGRYPDPAQAWAYVTAPALYRTDLELRDGRRRLMATPQFNAVPYPAQVQRLQKSAIEEGQRARGHTIVLPPKFWIYEPGDVGSWTSARNGYVEKSFRIDSSVDKANLDTAMTLTEVDPADFDWDHDGDFDPVTGGPTVIVPPPPQGIVDFTAEGVIMRDADGLPRRAAIRFTWDATVPAVLGVQYEVRLAADESDVTKGRIDQLTVGAGIIQQSLLPDTDYQIRARYIPSSPRPTLWSDWIDVTTPDVKLSWADVDAAIEQRVKELQGRLNDRLSEIEQTFATLQARLAGQGWSDIRSVRSELSAQAGTALARIEEVRSVAVDTEVAFASFATEVSATFGDAFSTISTVTEAFAEVNGWAAASVTTKVNVNGYVVGTQLVNGGPGLSAFIVQADKFQVQQPGVNGNAPIDVLTTGTIDGVPAIGIKANLYLDGFITARMMTVGSLDAVSGNMGTLTAGKIQSADGKFLIDCDNKRIVISDDS